MTDQTNTPEAPAPKSKPRRKQVRRRAAVAAPFEAPEEFEGMTAKDCCDACLTNVTAVEDAQARMNEIDRMYPRTMSRNPRSETVMENDAEWLERNPKLTDEWRRLCRLVRGTCAITGAPGCAHPFKGGLSPHLKRDPKAVARFQRAKQALRHQKINV